MYEQVLICLRLVASAEVGGRREARRQRYLDSETGSAVDTAIREPLFTIVMQPPAKPHSDSPTVTLEAGSWLKSQRHNPHVLFSTGDIRWIARIPRGKPSGLLAATFALTLQHYWRRWISKALLRRVGEDGRPSLRFQQRLQRDHLLTMFGPDPVVLDLLGTENPDHLRKYHDKAIALLRHEHRLIGWIEPIPSRGDENRRKGWVNPWLEQKLDIRPKHGTELFDELVRLNQSATRRSRRGKGKSGAAASMDHNRVEAVA